MTQNASLDILGVTMLYPTSVRPGQGAFVKAIFDELKSQSHRVRIIAPVPNPREIIDRISNPSLGREDRYKADNLVRPKYLAISSRICPQSVWPAQVTHQFLRRSVEKAEARSAHYDLCYAHFFSSGWSSLRMCRAKNVDLIVGIGESNLENVVRVFGRKVFRDTLSSFTGVVAVSATNEQFCRSICPEIGDNLLLLRNGVNLELFVPRDRTTCRQILDLPGSRPLVAFCGHFVERKGPFRVLDALQLLPDVGGIFIGQGPQIPAGDAVVHAGPVVHDEIPMWLSAADVFVLPSLAEGMSNAILEALAVGLPVVVADRPFNREYLDESCAVFVDPLSAQSIAKGISDVIGCQSRRKEMSIAARALAERHGLNVRMNRLLQFWRGIHGR